MTVSYDSLNNLKEMDIYLCNPSEERIAYIHATDRVVTACYNDLSTLTMNVYESSASVEFYGLLETMRLIEVTDVGYFQITDVKDMENAEGKYKEVTAESYQTVFKRFGIDVMNRLYSIYNPDAPTAALSDGDNAQDESFVPSIVAELHDQIGVAVDVQSTDIPDTTKHSVWTVTYVDSTLLGTYRTMDENVEFAYDLLVNKVEESFGCVVVFDYLYKSIKFYSITNVVKDGNAYLSYDNFLTDVEITEDASDITTVLRCEGDGVDISLVNPTGAGYIADFSYYMDETNHKWMSQSLIDKIKAWKAAIEANESDYATFVANYRNSLGTIHEREAELKEATTYIQNMRMGVDTYAAQVASGSYDDTHGVSVSIGEEVVRNGRSLASTSSFYNMDFTGTSYILAYSSPPAWDSNTGKFVFSGTGTAMTADSAANSNTLYFVDGDASRSYCKIKTKASISGDVVTYTASGFQRWVSYAFLGQFITLQEKQAAKIKSLISQQESFSTYYLSRMASINNTCGIKSFFSDTPDLYQELKKYWIEGTYTDSTIAVLETTTPEEAIQLAQELMSVGGQELSKVCQPRFKLSVTGVNCFASKELEDLAKELNLGNAVTVEKNEDGLCYHAVLLKITYNFDEPDQLGLELANSLRLDDWGFTMADLISSSSSTSRAVSSNWQELFAYMNDRSHLFNLVENPLDATLRAANANMSNQSFSVDTTGILGRKIDPSIGGDDVNIDGEQIRILNNVILFTRDGWDTASAAFGKITYPNPDPTGAETVTNYGLIADAIIGRLVMGERMLITTQNGNIRLDASGITIKDTNSNTTFSADTSGNVYLKGEIEAGSGKIAGWDITSSGLSKTAGTYTVGMYSGSTTSDYAFEVSDNGTIKFGVKNNGYMTATSGTIAGWGIQPAGLVKNIGSYVVGMYASTTNTGHSFRALYLDGSQDGQTLFSVDNDGSLVANSATIKGNISAKSFGIEETMAASKDADSLTIMKPVNVLGDGSFSGTVTSNTLSTGLVSTKYLTGTASSSGTTGTGSITVTVTAELGTGGMVKITYSFSEVSNWYRTDGAVIDLYIESRRNNGTVHDKVSYFIKPTTPNGSQETIYYPYDGIIYVGIKKQESDVATTSLTYRKQATYRAGGSGTNIIVGVVQGVYVHMIPFNNGSQNLGDTTHRWKTLYVTDPVDQSSSRDMKTDIKPLGDAQEKMFDCLIPRSFKFKNRDDTHYGFIVDEVVDAARKAGLDDKCGIYNLSNPNDPTVNASLRYNELIALTVAEIQKLKARVSDLERYIN